MVYESTHPLVRHKLGLLRNVATKPLQFRQLLSEITLLLSYEACSDLETRPIDVQTPMGVAHQRELAVRVGLVPVLRAALGMVEQVWTMIPSAEVWHVGMYRDEQTLQPVFYYDKFHNKPRIDLALLLDPMLATGGSAVATANRLKQWGVSRIRYVGIIAAPEGIAALQSAHPDIPIYVAEIDSHLNEIGYIVPGLGDAGDRQFGTF